MRSLKGLRARSLADDSGTTAIEYALIASGIGLAILVSLNALSSAINTNFGTIVTSLN
jgi:pilus assembly protein Flp/PilA